MEYVFQGQHHMLPNAAFLQLTPEGLTVCSMYWSHFYRWRAISGFTVGRVGPNKMVMFNFEPSFQKLAGFRSLSVKLTGYEAGLPDNYGLSHEALAELLNQYKASYGS